jgi:hypothetical protein
MHVHNIIIFKPKHQSITMYSNIIYPNYVSLHQQDSVADEAYQYQNYVNSTIGSGKVVAAPSEDFKVALGAARSMRDASGQDERLIHAKMLEQGTLHRCAMLRYNNARSSTNTSL